MTRTLPSQPHGLLQLPCATRPERGARVRFKPVRGSVNDLAVIDRFISEIKSRLFRAMRDQDTGGRWVDLLPVIVKNYNEKTIHSAVSSEPAAVEGNDYLSKYLLRERNTAKMWKNVAQHRKTQDAHTKPGGLRS